MNNKEAGNKDTGKENSDKVQVTVQYVGHEDFRDSVPPSESLQAIKVRALKAFGIEPSAADKYVLQFNGADVADKSKVETYGKGSVVFTLALKDEVLKGAYGNAW